MSNKLNVVQKSIAIAVLFSDFINQLNTDVPGLTVVEIPDVTCCIFSVHEDYYDQRSLEDKLDRYFYGKYEIRYDDYRYTIKIQTDIDESSLESFAKKGRLEEGDIKAIAECFHKTQTVFTGYWK